MNTKIKLESSKVLCDLCYKHKRLFNLVLPELFVCDNCRKEYEAHFKNE